VMREAVRGVSPGLVRVPGTDPIGCCCSYLRRFLSWLAFEEWQVVSCRAEWSPWAAEGAPQENRRIGAGSTRAASEARIATDRWLNEGGSLGVDAAAPPRGPMS
jgi:hypothetical protein